VSEAGAGGAPLWWGDADRLPELHEVLDAVFPAGSSGNVWNGDQEPSLIPAEPDDAPVRPVDSGPIPVVRASTPGHVAGWCERHNLYYAGGACPRCSSTLSPAGAFYRRFGLWPRA
jgi:hypothetical protein